MAAVFERHTVLSTSGTYKTGNDGGGGGGGKKRVEADFEKKEEEGGRINSAIIMVW